MSNRARGERTITVGETEYTLCLTLGALAEIEDKLEIEDITKIGEVFKTPKVKHLTAILLALMHGGGHPEVDRDTLYAMPLNLKELQSTIQEVFQAAMRDSSPASSKGDSPGELPSDPE